MMLENLRNGAHQPTWINATVFPKGAILLHDERLNEIGRHLGFQVLDAAAILAVQGADFVAFAV